MEKMNIYRMILDDFEENNCSLLTSYLFSHNNEDTIIDFISNYEDTIGCSCKNRLGVSYEILTLIIKEIFKDWDRYDKRFLRALI